MTPYYRPATLDDAYELAPKLREVDVQEVKDSSGVNALDALLISVTASSEAYSIIANDGEVIGMFGVSPTADPDIGVPWLLCSDRLPEVKKEFIPQSAEWVIEVNKKFPVLCNYVAKDNKVAIRWLRHLGFTFTQLIETFGVGKKPFYEFVRIKDV